SPAMKLIPGLKITDSGVSYLVATEPNAGMKIALPIPVRTGNVDLGIRPEAIHVESGSNGDITRKLALIEPIGSVTHYYIEWPNAFGGSLVASVSHGAAGLAALNTLKLGDTEIGRASCRERGEIAGGRVGVKK